MPNDNTVVLVTWTVTDPAVTTLSLEMEEGGEGQWKHVTGANNLSKATAKLKVADLKADEKYRFRIDMRRPWKQDAFYVYSNIGIPFISLFINEEISEGGIDLLGDTRRNIFNYSPIGDRSGRDSSFM